MKPILICLFIFLYSNNGYNQKTILDISHFNHKDGIALEQHDAVEYFNSNKAVKGLKNISVKVGDVSFYFINNKNKLLFEKETLKYLPQYGGWCAYAMGIDGDKVAVDPNTFKIVDGKLYLFYNKFFNNTLKSWNKNEKVLMKNADLNWEKINN